MTQGNRVWSPSRRDFQSLNNQVVIPSDVYAVREFQVDSTGKIMGLSVPQEFSLSNVNVSSCSKMPLHDAPAPARDCSCGFYVYDNTDYWWSTEKEELPDGTVKAVVRVSGKIIVCNNGLRAEKIEICALAASSSTLRRIFADQDESVKVFSSVSEMLEKFTILPLSRSNHKSGGKTRKTFKDYIGNRDFWFRFPLIGLILSMSILPFFAVAFMSYAITVLAKNKYLFFAFNLFFTFIAINEFSNEIWNSETTILASLMGVCLIVNFALTLVQFQKFFSQSLKINRLDSSPEKTSKILESRKYSPFQFFHLEPNIEEKPK